MREQSPGFVADGWRRLITSPRYRQHQAAIEARIREKYSAELSAAADYWQRVALEDKIQREIKESRPSPYALWTRI